MRYIFITGMGRSGTTWLAGILGHLRNATAMHEEIGGREYWLLSWYLNGNEYALPYLERERKRLDKNYNQDYFIDTNGYLQNSVPQLREVFEPAKVFHLVRDGRAVVRSLYSRRYDSWTHLIPKNRTEIESWIDGDKFFQVCWNWAETTKRLISEGTSLIHFEELVADYDYFSENILTPFAFELSRAQWEAGASKKVNSTRSSLYRYLYAKYKGGNFVKETIPSYKNWTKEQQQIFTDICGEAMEMAGYKLA